MTFEELTRNIAASKARIIAIDGNCASGKTTLAKALSDHFHATVFRMDDFFLRPEQRTAERRAEIGGNVDRERFLEEILLPLKAHQPVSYRRFDCHTMSLCPPVTLNPAEHVIIEGSYALHPLLRPYYDLKILLTVDPAIQRERILLRESAERVETFFSLWLPLENCYFAAFDPKEADIVIDMSIPML